MPWLPVVLTQTPTRSLLLVCPNPIKPNPDLSPDPHPEGLARAKFYAVPTSSLSDEACNK
jgi:hypothetical protein